MGLADSETEAAPHLQHRGTLTSALTLQPLILASAASFPTQHNDLGRGGLALQLLDRFSSEDVACAPSSSGALPSLCCLHTGWAFYFGHTDRLPPACGVHPRGSCFRTYRCELGFVCGLLCGLTAIALLVPLLPCRIWIFCANCHLATHCHLLLPTLVLSKPRCASNRSGPHRWS